MRTLNAEEAANLLHLNVKRVQDLARSGKLPAVRVGRKWLFHRRDLDRLLGQGKPSTLPLERASARNQLRGEVTSLRQDGLMAEVKVRIGDQELVSMITRSSSERLGLRVGDPVYAVIKSTEIMIARGSET